MPESWRVTQLHLPLLLISICFAGCAAQPSLQDKAPLPSSSEKIIAGEAVASDLPQDNVLTPELDDRDILIIAPQGLSNPTLLTMGIPFAPGVLFDESRLRILGPSGSEVPSFARPVLQWHFLDDSIRALKVQFYVEPEQVGSEFRFATDMPKTQFMPEDSFPAEPAVDELPAAMGVLSPGWMSESGIAGPQVATSKNHPQRRYFATQYQWASQSAYERGNVWLYDRASTILKEYVRTGLPEYLIEGLRSYLFYIDKIDPEGAPGWPACGGGWVYDRVDKCDSKFVYIEPVLLYIGLTGDDSIIRSNLIDAMVGAWTTGGWAERSGPYADPDATFTERRAGLGLVSTVAAFEITANPDFLTLIHNRIAWLHEHQNNNPDGLEADGSWRHSWQKHEGDSYNPATDPRGGSPWMSENIIDGLWHAWQVVEDARIPSMVIDFGLFMENYGWIRPEAFRKAGHSWRRKCSGVNGQIPWYWSSSHVELDKLIRIQDSEGWFSDSHSVELTFAILAAHYFAEDEALKAQFLDRLQKLRSSFAPRCARNSRTARMFNWNNRSFSSYLWQQAFDGD